MSDKTKPTDESGGRKYILRATTAALVLVGLAWLVISNGLLRTRTTHFSVYADQQVLAEIVVVFPAGLSIDDNSELAINVSSSFSVPITITNSIILDPKWFHLGDNVSSSLVFSNLQPGEVRTEVIDLHTTGLMDFDKPIVSTTRISIRPTVCCAANQQVFDILIDPAKSSSFTIERWLFPFADLLSTPGLRAMLTGIDFKFLSAIATGLSALLVNFFSFAVLRFWGPKPSPRGSQINKPSRVTPQRE